MRSKKTSQLAGIIFSIILFSLIIFVLPAQAIEPTSPTDKINTPTLEIIIPGLNFTNLGTLSNAKQVGIPWLGEYIVAIFQFGTAISSIIAVIMIIIYGIQIVLSGDGQAKMAAYKNIGRIFIGLILLWGSYVILYNININLTVFKPLVITTVDVSALDLDPILGPDTNAPAGLPGNLAVIPAIQHVTMNRTLYALPSVITAFQSAMIEYAKDVYLSDAARTADAQYQLMQTYCDCQAVGTLPADVAAGDWKKYCPALDGCRASPSVIRKNGQFQVQYLVSHFSGAALDVSTGDNVDCGSVDSNTAMSQGVLAGSGLTGKCIPMEQQKFIRAMINNGFCVGLKSSSSLRESWHFELTTAGVTNSIFCTNNLSDSSLQKLLYTQNTNLQPSK